MISTVSYRRFGTSGSPQKSKSIVRTTSVVTIVEILILELLLAGMIILSWVRMTAPEVVVVVVVVVIAVATTIITGPPPSPTIVVVASWIGLRKSWAMSEVRASYSRATPTG